MVVLTGVLVLARWLAGGNGSGGGGGGWWLLRDRGVVRRPLRGEGERVKCGEEREGKLKLWILFFVFLFTLPIEALDRVWGLGNLLTCHGLTLCG